MDKLQLYPVTNSGYNFYRNTTYNAATDPGKVSGLMFLNQGTNSRAVITFGGCSIVLLPGEGQEITVPTFGYDTSLYHIAFTPINLAAAFVHNLVGITQKFTPQQ